MASSLDSPTTASDPIRRKPKLFYGWWMLIGGGVLSFVISLVSFHELSSFREAISDSFLETDPQYNITRGWNYAYESLFWLSRSLIVGLVVAPIVGVLLDRYGPRRLLLFTVLVTVAGFFVITQVQNDWQKHTATLIITVGVTSITSVVLIGALGKWFVTRRVLAFAILAACSSFASVFSLVSIVALHEHGWRFMAVIAGVGLLIVGIPVALMMRRQPEDHGSAPDGGKTAADPNHRSRREVHSTARQTIRLPVFWQITVAGGLSAGAMSQLSLDPEKIGFYSSNLQEVFQLGYASTLLGIVGVIAVGFIGIRLKSTILILAILGSMVVGYTGLVLIYLVDASPFEYPLFAAFSTVTSITKSTIVFVQFAILAEYLGTKHYGAVVGFAVAVNAGISFGIIFLAPMAYWPFSSFADDVIGFNLVVFALGVAALAIAALLIIRLESKSRVAARIHLANRKHRHQPTT